MEGSKRNSHSVGQNGFHLVWKVKYSYEGYAGLLLVRLLRGLLALFVFSVVGMFMSFR